MLMLRVYQVTNSQEPFGVWAVRLDEKTSALLGPPKLTSSTSNQFIKSLSATADLGNVAGLLEGGQANVYYYAEAQSLPLAGAKRLTVTRSTWSSSSTSGEVFTR